jgi:YVTN family beta-propeller protein
VGTYFLGNNTLPYELAFDGTNIWITNEGNGTVMKMVASTATVVATYTVGSVPWGIVFDGANIWAANEGSSTLSMIPVH